MATSRVPFEWPTPTPSFARFEKHEHVVGESKPTYYSVRQGPQSPYQREEPEYHKEPEWFATSTSRTTLQHRQLPRYLDAGTYRRGLPQPFADSPFSNEQDPEDLLRGRKAQYSKEGKPSAPREQYSVNRNPLTPPKEPYSPPREYSQQEKPRTSSYGPQLPPER